MHKYLHTPDGVRDYLPLDFAIKSALEHRLGDIFRLYGYARVSSPAFEHAEVFEGSQDYVMYKFPDRNGLTLALRPDMTPAIARIASTSLDSNALPYRLCYIENMFRNNENYQGKSREFTQAGIELIGVKSLEADAEAVSVAYHSLLAVGLKDFKICISYAPLLNDILEEAGTENETRQAILQYASVGDFTEIERLTSQLSSKELAIFKILPALTGGEEVINTVKPLISGEKTKKSLSILCDIYALLRDYGISSIFDLGMAGHFGYYTGLIFRCYAAGSGVPIIDGGRYDTLCSKFNANYPAVGFAIKCEQLIQALDYAGQGLACQPQKAETLVAFTEKGRCSAQKAAMQLRGDGVAIENSLCKNNLDANLEYARRKGFGGMLFFENEQTVRIYDFINNTEKVCDISDLLEN